MSVRRNVVDGVVDDLLNAWAHVFDTAGRESLHYKPAQSGVIGRILLQHPMTHAAIDRLVEYLAALATGHATDEILAEAPIAQNPAHIRVAARDVKAKR